MYVVGSGGEVTHDILCDLLIDLRLGRQDFISVHWAASHCDSESQFRRQR